MDYYTPKSGIFLPQNVRFVPEPEAEAEAEADDLTEDNNDFSKTAPSLVERVVADLLNKKEQDDE